MIVMSPEVVNGVFAVSGAVIGAALTGFFSLYQAKRTRERREITILSTFPSELIDVDPSVSEIVELTIAGKRVPTVFLVDITIRNSGNVPLHEIGFPLVFKGEVEVLSVLTSNQNFAHKEDELETAHNDGIVNVCAKFLNPGDQFMLRVLLSTYPDSWEPRFRQPGVALLRHTTDPTSPAVAIAAIMDAARSSFLMHTYLKLVLPTYREYLAVERKARSNGSLTMSYYEDEEDEEDYQ